MSPRAQRHRGDLPRIDDFAVAAATRAPIASPCSEDTRAFASRPTAVRGETVHIPMLRPGSTPWISLSIPPDRDEGRDDDRRRPRRAVVRERRCADATARPKVDELQAGGAIERRRNRALAARTLHRDADLEVTPWGVRVGGGGGGGPTPRPRIPAAFISRSAPALVCAIIDAAIPTRAVPEQ